MTVQNTCSGKCTHDIIALKSISLIIIIQQLYQTTYQEKLHAQTRIVISKEKNVLDSIYNTKFIQSITIR